MSLNEPEAWARQGGQKISVIVATVKSCVFNLHGAYADGSNTDSTSIDLCKDKSVNLIE
jgi:hypothetical protein